MQKAFLIAIGAGALSAIASVAIISGMPLGILLVYLAPLPLMVSGLALGVPAATVAGGSGIVVAVIVGGALAGGIYGVLHALPAWLVVRQALINRTDEAGNRRWFPEGHIIASLSVLALSILAGFGLIYIYGQGGDQVGAQVGGTIEASITAALNQSLSALIPTLGDVERADAVAILAAYLPGTVGSSWVAMLIINALLAQNILVRAKKNIRPPLDTSGLDVPNWVSWALVLAAGFALLGTGDIGYIARNSTMILATPFFFLGLAVAHFMAKRTTFPGTTLVAVYAAMLITRWALLGVTGLGVIEQWVGIRRHFQGPENGQEDK